MLCKDKESLLSRTRIRNIITEEIIIENDAISAGRDICPAEIIYTENKGCHADHGNSI